MNDVIQKEETLMDLQLFLANAFGLNTKNLRSFCLTVNTNELPIITAVYRTEKDDKVDAICKSFNLKQIGINEKVELPSCNGVKEDTTLKDTVRHYRF